MLINFYEWFLTCAVSKWNVEIKRLLSGEVCDAQTKVKIWNLFQNWDQLHLCIYLMQWFYTMQTSDAIRCDLVELCRCTHVICLHCIGLRTLWIWWGKWDSVPNKNSHLRMPKFVNSWCQYEIEVTQNSMALHTLCWYTGSAKCRFHIERKVVYSECYFACLGDSRSIYQDFWTFYIFLLAFWKLQKKLAHSNKLCRKWLHYVYLPHIQSIHMSKMLITSWSCDSYDTVSI